MNKQPDMQDIDRDKSYIEKRVLTYISKIEECLFNDSKTILGIDIITDDYTSDGYTNILYHYNPAEYQKYIVEKYFNSDNGLPSLIDTLDWNKHFWVYDIENNEVNGKFKNRELCLEEFSVGIGEANYNRNQHNKYWNKWIETTKEYFGNLKSIIFIKNYFVSEDKSEIKCGLFIYCKDKQLNFLKERGHNRISNLRHFSNNLLNDAFIYSYVDPAKKELRKVALQSAVAQVFARNFAHNIGSHVAIRATNRMAKERIAELYKIEKTNFKDNIEIESWLDYMGEKLDLFEVARNEFLAGYKMPAKNAMLYRDVVLPFCENTLLMDNIAHSEGIHYKNTCENKLKIQVLINGVEILAKYPSLKSYDECEKTPIFYPYNFPYLVKATDGTIEAAFANKRFYDYQGNEASDIEICLTNEHTLYSILENVIRNSAKHNKSAITEKEGLIISVNIGDENDDYYKIQISDNVSKVSEEQLNKFAKSIAASLITNDGEIQKESLGIADIKINAHLLKTDTDITNANLSEALTLVYQKSGSKIFDKYETIPEPSKENTHNFGYQFKLCKPKKVIWIGKSEDKNLKKKGIICIANYKNFKPEGQAKTEEPLANYQFAILELESVKELTNDLIFKDVAKNEVDNKASYQWDDFLIKLPHRVLLNCTEDEFDKLNKENNKAIIDLKNDGRIQLVKQKIPLPTETEGDKNKDWDFDFLKNCWENWLRKWIKDKERARLIVYFEDESVADKWKDCKINNSFLDTIFITGEKPEDTKYISASDKDRIVIFDHHSYGYEWIDAKVDMGFIERSSYFQFGKNSQDFVRFFYPQTDLKSNELFLLEAFEAGLNKVAILDERICEMLGYSDSDKNIQEKITKNQGFKAKLDSVGDYADLANNGSIFIVTTFLDNIITTDNTNGKITLSSNNKFELTLPKEVVLKGGIEIDSLIIHRTYLNNLFDKFQRQYTKKHLMNLLYKSFKRVTVVSGGGYPHSIDFKVSFKPYSQLKQNFIQYPSKVSLNQII